MHFLRVHEPVDFRKGADLGRAEGPRGGATGIFAIREAILVIVLLILAFVEVVLIVGLGGIDLADQQVFAGAVVAIDIPVQIVVDMVRAFLRGILEILRARKMDRGIANLQSLAIRVRAIDASVQIVIDPV